MYYVEFVGELKNNKNAQKIFMKQYNKMCDCVNELIPHWNDQFDEFWDEPIEDYSLNESYQRWMRNKYRTALVRNKLHKDFLFVYSIDDDLQLWATFKYGISKGQKISFVLREA